MLYTKVLGKHSTYVQRVSGKAHTHARIMQNNVQTFHLSLLLPYSLLCLIPSPHIHIFPPTPFPPSPECSITRYQSQRWAHSHWPTALPPEWQPKTCCDSSMYTYYVLYGGHIILMWKFILLIYALHNTIVLILTLLAIQNNIIIISLIHYIIQVIKAHY